MDRLDSEELDFCTRDLKHRDSVKMLLLTLTHSLLCFVSGVLKTLAKSKKVTLLKTRLFWLKVHWVAGGRAPGPKSR